MLNFDIVNTYTDPETNDIGAVVMNDRHRPGHDFKDIFPYVKLNGEIYKTIRVHSNQVHTVKKGTRIIIYPKLD